MGWIEDWKPEQMTFAKACSSCHVRSAIMRVGNPDMKYWKNDFTPLSERVPLSEQAFNDWIEYDPRDHEECSAFNEMPA